MTFTEEWFGPASCQALAGLFDKVRHLDGVVVEVGCWEGRSTIALADACHPAFVRAVDTWEGSPGEISAELAKERDVLGTFMANTAGRNVDVYAMDWQTYFDSHHDQIRFLHIDAEHTFDQVYGNVAAALPLMVPGGVICGDDAHHPPIQKAVLSHFPAAQVIATLWWVQL